MKLLEQLQSEILLLCGSTRTAVDGRHILKAGECAEYLNMLKRYSYIRRYEIKFEQRRKAKPK